VWLWQSSTISINDSSSRAGGWPGWLAGSYYTTVLVAGWVGGGLIRAGHHYWPAQTSPPPTHINTLSPASSSPCSGNSPSLPLTDPKGTEL